MSCGWQPVVQPIDALEELLDWYGSQPDFDASTSPSFTDRFDYDTEDTLIAAYQRTVGTITDTVEQHEAPPVHSMPHPTRSRRGRPPGPLITAAVGVVGLASGHAEDRSRGIVDRVRHRR